MVWVWVNFFFFPVWLPSMLFIQQIICKKPLRCLSDNWKTNYKFLHLWNETEPMVQSYGTEKQSLCSRIFFFLICLNKRKAWFKEKTSLSEYHLSMFYSKNMAYLWRIVQMASRLYPTYSLLSGFISHWPTATMPQVLLLVTVLGQAVPLHKACLHMLLWYWKASHNMYCSIISALAKLG